MTEPVRCSDDVEQLLPDEDAVIDETVRTMRHTMEQTFEKLRHQTSGTHATRWPATRRRRRASSTARPTQLCTDLDRMPVEYAAKEWPEDESHYRTVATVTLPAQASFSPARRTYAEDALSWRPWSGLAAHRPLGSINRVRNRAYAELRAFRHSQNARTEENPTSLAQVPA